MLSFINLLSNLDDSDIVVDTVHDDAWLTEAHESDAWYAFHSEYCPIDCVFGNTCTMSYIVFG